MLESHIVSPQGTVPYYLWKTLTPAQEASSLINRIDRFAHIIIIIYKQSYLIGVNLLILHTL